MPWLCSSTFNPVFTFPYNINGGPCNMVFTSVAGHLMELEFGEAHRKWHACSPVELYSAPVFKRVPPVRPYRAYSPMARPLNVLHHTYSLPLLHCQIMHGGTQSPGAAKPDCFKSMVCMQQVRLGASPYALQHACMLPTAAECLVNAAGQEANRAQPAGAGAALPVADPVA